jgi:hypothetical protein
MMSGIDFALFVENIKNVKTGWIPPSCQHHFSRTELLIVPFQAPCRPLTPDQLGYGNTTRIRQVLKYHAGFFAFGILVSIKVFPNVQHVSIFESSTDDRGRIEDVGRESRASESDAYIRSIGTEA